MTEWFYLVSCQEVTIRQEKRMIKKNSKEHQRDEEVYVSESLIYDEESHFA